MSLKATRIPSAPTDRRFQNCSMNFSRWYSDASFRNVSRSRSVGLDLEERLFRRDGRRQEHGVALEQHPVAVLVRARFGMEDHVRVLAELRMLEVGPDLERPEEVGTGDLDARVRRAGADVDE